MREFRMWMKAAILVCGMTTVLTSCSNKNKNTAAADTVSEQSEAPDYSDKNNWLKLPDATKDVDCFYVYPTEYVDDSEEATTFADINEKMMREAAPRTYLVQGAAFEDVANVFAPYYRQLNMVAAAAMTHDEMEKAFASTRNLLRSRLRTWAVMFFRGMFARP